MATYKTVDADSLDADLLAVANTIRSKGGTSGSLAFPSGFQSAIQSIQVGVDTSDATATAEDIISGKTAYVGGEKKTGTLTVANYYYGASDPAASLGVNGDLYFKMEG